MKKEKDTKKVKKEKKKSKLALIIEAFRAERAKNDPDNMTPEERERHEEYVRELTAENKKTVRKISTILWILAMLGWTIFLVLEIVLKGSPIKMLFYGAGMALTAALAINRVIEFFTARKQKADVPAEDDKA